MTIDVLKKLSAHCSHIFISHICHMGQFYRAVFLMASFAFLRLSNIVWPVLIHLDIIQTKIFLLLKLCESSPQMVKNSTGQGQSADFDTLLTEAVAYCPYKALKKVFRLYAPLGRDSFLKVGSASD